MAKRFIIIFFIVLVTLGYGAYQALQLDDKLASTQALHSDSVISKMPQASFKRFDSEQIVDLQKDFVGKNVVVHFWATWCGPCETEFPQFKQMLSSTDFTNTVFLFVAVNDSQDQISKFIKRFPNLMSKVVLIVDDSDISQQYFGTYKLPETYIFDTKMLLVRKFTGPQEWGSNFFRTFFDSLN